jgi:hypothetical protein
MQPQSCPRSIRQQEMEDLDTSNMVPNSFPVSTASSIQTKMVLLRNRYNAGFNTRHKQDQIALAALHAVNKEDAGEGEGSEEPKITRSFIDSNYSCELLKSSSSGYIKRTKELLDAKGDPNVIDLDGNTALFWPCQRA